MKKSHYVPMLTLRKFSEKICLYDVKKGIYKENCKIEKSFCEKGFYSDDVEENLNKKIESQFGNLFSNKLLKAENKIELKRDELNIIKKFLLISIIRSIGSEELMKLEKYYYNNLNKYFEEKGLAKVDPPFEEKNIANESNNDYWMRTINVILDTNGTPEEIFNHPDKTYAAYRWSKVINNGYIAFWDSDSNRDEFVITDIGMTSENELGWNVTGVNNKKIDFLYSLFINTNNMDEMKNIYKCIEMNSNFSENFMMFPISSKRMIVEICPFYKFRNVYKEIYEMPKLEKLTNLPNEDLFSPNTNKYFYEQKYNEPIKYHPDDLYIYDIKKLNRKEVRYCNELFLDRIDTTLGFTSLDKVVGSLLAYKKDNEYPYTPRVNYSNLYKIINERYNGSLKI